MFWTAILLIVCWFLVVGCLKFLFKFLGLILPQIVRVIIALAAGIAGTIYLFTIHWATGVFLGIPLIIVCYLFGASDDTDFMED